MKKRSISFFLALVLIVSTFAGIFAMPAEAATNTKKGTASDIVAVALGEKAGTGGSKYNKFFGTSGQGWCTYFVAWCADQAGASSAIKKLGGVKDMYDSVKKRGGYEVTESQVKPGDLIFYKNSHKGWLHVAIVTKSSGKNATATHGNFSGVVKQGYPITSGFSDGCKDSKGKLTHWATRIYIRPNYNDAPTDNGNGNGSGDSGTTIVHVDPSPTTFLMVNQGTGKALEVKGSATSSASKSNVQVAAVTEKKNQIFAATKASKGWYSIIPSSGSKLAVNPNSDTPKNGTNVNVYKLDSADKTQCWYFEKSGDGYIVRNAYKESVVLTAESGGNVKVATYSKDNKYQIWTLKAPSGASTTPDPKPATGGQPTSGKTYTLANKASNKVLDVFGNTPSNTANVQIYAKASSSAKTQQFKINKTSGGWFSIVPASNTKLAVNPNSDAPKNGTNVNVYTLNAKDKTQGWVFEQVGDYYIIRCAYNNKLVLTADGTKDMSNVKLATYSADNDKQLWKLKAV